MKYKINIIKEVLFKLLSKLTFAHIMILIIVLIMGAWLLFGSAISIDTKWIKFNTHPVIISTDKIEINNTTTKAK